MSEKKEVTELVRYDTGWPKKLALVKAMVAKDCTDTEFELLVHLAKENGLDPLKREIFAIKYGAAPAQIFAGRNGLLSIAHRRGQFGSMKTDIHEEEGKPVSATCEIYRKDYDKPFVATVYFSEYNKNTPIWHEKPRTMLTKVAEAACLRRAFNISGIYVEEEMPEPEKKED